MPKSPKAPNGLYTAGEAIRRLGIPPTTFHHYVKIGKIKKVVPPGRSEGYYEKAYINEMARANQLFAIQYATDQTKFSVATPEDAQGIYDVIASLWGTLFTTPVATRLSWYEKNSSIDYVVKKENIVAGYITVMPLKHEVIEQLMEEKIRGWDIKAEDILPFTPGIPLECYTGAAVRAGVYQPKRYGMRLLMGIMETMQELARKGVIIKKLYAVSDTPDGVELSRNLGFEEEPPAPNSTFRRFTLDLETSDSPYAIEYRRILDDSKTERKTRTKTDTSGQNGTKQKTPSRSKSRSTSI